MYISYNKVPNFNDCSHFHIQDGHYLRDKTPKVVGGLMHQYILWNEYLVQ